MPRISVKRSDESIIIKQELSVLAEESYRDFASSLLPGVSNILGVRLPALRKLAKRLVKEDWQGYFAQCSQDSFEEIMLKGFLIGYAAEYGKLSLSRLFEEIDAYLPWIDNWSVCDSFCITLKIAASCQEEFWAYLHTCLGSEEAFTLRFAVVMLLDYYINDTYIDRLYPIFESIAHSDYYVKMAVAWAISMCYVKYPDRTEQYLRVCRLDDFTYNKALQKITESLSVDRETKKRIKSMKRGIHHS